LWMSLLARRPLQVAELVRERWVERASHAANVAG